jgi:hypothetical protein
LEGGIDRFGELIPDVLADQFRFGPFEDPLGAVVEMGELPLVVQDEDRVGDPAVELPDALGGASGLAFGAVLRNRVVDPIGWYGVLVGTRSLVEILADPGGDRFAGDFLASSAGKEDKR